MNQHHGPVVPRPSPGRRVHLLQVESGRQQTGQEETTTKSSGRSALMSFNVLCMGHKHGHEYYEQKKNRIICLHNILDYTHDDNDICFEPGNVHVSNRHGQDRSFKFSFLLSIVM
jgi:hypothetical protein